MSELGTCYTCGWWQDNIPGILAKRPKTKAINAKANLLNSHEFSRCNRKQHSTDPRVPRGCTLSYESCKHYRTQRSVYLDITDEVLKRHEGDLSSVKYKKKVPYEPRSG